MLGRLATILDLACLMIGAFLFAVFAIGYVAAVRLSEKLLLVYSGTLVGLTLLTFLASVVIALVPFIANPIFHSIIKADVLRYYGNNPDWDHLINFLQSRLSCCGIGPASFRDWDHWDHFRCSADNPSADRCGVPPSCCRDRKRARVDRFCGKGAQDSSNESVRDRVYNRGCFRAVVDVVRGKLLVIGSPLILVTLLLSIAATTARAMREQEIRCRSKLQVIADNASDAAESSTRRRVSWDDLEDTSSLIYRQPEVPYADTTESTVLFADGKADHGEWLQFQEHAYPNESASREGTAVWPPVNPDYCQPYQEPENRPQTMRQYPDDDAISPGYYDAAGYAAH